MWTVSAHFCNLIGIFSTVRMCTRCSVKERERERPQVIDWPTGNTKKCIQMLTAFHREKRCKNRIFHTHFCGRRWEFKPRGEKSVRFFVARTEQTKCVLRAYQWCAVSKMHSPSIYGCIPSPQQRVLSLSFPALLRPRKERNLFRFYLRRTCGSSLNFYSFFVSMARLHRVYVEVWEAAD